MTTNVIVLTHDWPVQIDAIDTIPDGDLPTQTVATVSPRSHYTTYVASTRRLVITELPKP